MTTTEWMVLAGGLGLAAGLIALFRAMLNEAYDAGFEDGYAAARGEWRRSRVEGERSRVEVKVEVEGERSRFGGERSRFEVKVNGGLATSSLNNAAFSDAERIPRLRLVGGDPRAPRNPDSTNAAFGGDCGAFGERPLPAQQTRLRGPLPTNNLTTQQPNNLTTQQPNNLTTQQPNNPTPDGQHDKEDSADLSTRKEARDDR